MLLYVNGSKPFLLELRNLKRTGGSFGRSLALYATQQFTFDHVYDQDTTQNTIYQAFLPDSAVLSHHSAPLCTPSRGPTPHPNPSQAASSSSDPLIAPMDPSSSALWRVWDLTARCTLRK